MKEQAITMETLHSQKLSLLLIDDDIELCGMMKEFFSESGHIHLDCAYDGRSGLSQALNGSYDLVILDVMLPFLDGFSLLHQLRRRKDLPVVMLTARVQRSDKIQGLNTGADDYLPKPFDPDELLARIRAVLRRSTSTGQRENAVLNLGDLQINTMTREATLHGSVVELTGMEFDLLEMLTRAPGRVVSRDEISVVLFERAPTSYDRVLDVHVSHLRKKLERSGNRIRTIRGVGYVFSEKS